jgi:ubiquinone/menaquinone biosynthesis C-methylase UbiE
MQNFYKRFKTITRLPFWRPYLKKVYKLSQEDAENLGIKPISKRKKFTTLLCGVSGEITAEEYTDFVLGINPDAKIIIIDLGNEQIKSIKRLVSLKYIYANIIIKQANALNLSFIKDNSIDWIDTDGFLSFFDAEMLFSLFSEWKRILKKDGYITFREIISVGLISWSVNYLRKAVSLFYINTNLYIHNKKELLHNFSKLKFKYSVHRSPVPLLNRYCLGF